MTRVILMGVPWDAQRLASVSEICEQVPDVEIVWDQRQSGMDTWLRAFDLAGIDPAVYLEDDVILTTNWREKVEAVIESRIDDPIQFFSRGPANEARGLRYRPGSSFSMNQCYYLPRHLSARVRRYAEGWISEHPEHPNGYDLLMASAFREWGVRYWAEIPSLVQHRELPSLLGPRSTKRQSESFQP